MAESITYLCINLPQAEERRKSILAQAERLGVNIQLVEAVAGKDLPAEVPEYDRKRRKKLFTKDLSANEIACTLSHKKALRTFLESEAEYAVIMEDDAVLSENFNAGIRELVDHLHGWEAAKLFTEDNSILYPLGAATADARAAVAPVVSVFPKKISWVSVGWLYTRRGAEALLEGLSSFYFPTDVEIAKVLCRKNIPTIGVTPSLITTSDPDSVNSTIVTAESPRGITTTERRSLCQYIAYRLSVWETSSGKKRMCKMMRKLLIRC